jgi:hypothetical protein
MHSGCLSFSFNVLTMYSRLHKSVQVPETQKSVFAMFAHTRKEVSFDGTTMQGKGLQTLALKRFRVCTNPPGESDIFNYYCNSRR